jgi:hypothetical protein
VLPVSAYNCAIDRPNDSHAVPVPVTGNQRNGWPRSVSIALAAISGVAVIAACGSSGKPGGTPGSRDPALLEAQCLRSHGVPNFSDPSPGGPSVIPNWINPQAPAFKSAEKACARYLGDGSGQGSGSESERLQLLNLAKCMRAHGLPNFPDPTTSPPPAPPPGSHTGNAIGIGGAYLVIPSQSPALKRAAAACGFKLS